MRWTGSGEYTTEDEHKIWYCGQEKKKQHGVIMAIHVLKDRVCWKVYVRL